MKTTIELSLYCLSWLAAILIVAFPTVGLSNHLDEIHIESVWRADILDDLNKEQYRAEQPTVFGATKTPEGQRPSVSSYERDWIKWLAKGDEYPALSGVPEFKTYDGSYVDILSGDGHAIEVEWISKWKEAIGQSLYYAAITDTKPGIVVLMKGEENEKLYYMRMMVVAIKYDIKVWIVETNKGALE